MWKQRKAKSKRVTVSRTSCPTTAETRLKTLCFWHMYRAGDISNLPRDSSIRPQPHLSCCYAARYTPLPTNRPRTPPCAHSRINIDHTHTTPSFHWEKWQTVLATSTNGHFNALEVTGLVSGGVIFTGPEFLIWILQRGQCPRAGEVVDDETPPHAHRGLSMSPLRPFPHNHILTLHPFPPTVL